MKFISSGLTLIFILILSTTLLIAGDVQKTGKLDLSELAFDFGRVPRDAQVMHNFILKNIGNDTLNILNIKPT